MTMKRTKQTVSVFLSLLLAVSFLFSFGLNSYAEELRYFERGVLTDGTNTAYYVIDKDNKVLYITGDGNNNAYTPDYPSADEGPFAGRTDITRVVIEEDVAKVGDYALANLKKVDTLEVQSNLLSSSSSMSSKAMIGCTGLRHIQGDSALLSTDVFLQVVKGALNIASGNWLSLVSNGVSIISTGVNGDGSLDNETIHCMVDDYINNGNKIFLGELDDAKAAYNERLASPCYSNNAFHHDYFDYVSVEPTCTAAGEKTYFCGVCGEKVTEPIAPLGHEYTSSTLYETSCFTEGITKYSCARCGNATYEAIPAYGHHTYDGYVYDEANDAYTEICAVCNHHNTQFDNDTSALISAVDMAEALDSADYTPASYHPVADAVERYLSLTEEDYLQYPQAKVDEKVAEILTKMDALVPYLTLKVGQSVGGRAAVEYDDFIGIGSKYSLEQGTEVTLTATPAAGYTFVGWYEKTTKRMLSTDAVYTFTLTSNTDLVARFTSAEDATLYFECRDGQIKAYFNKKVDVWASMTSIESLLPEIPYSYGYTNGYWDYTDEAALAALQNGEDYTVHAVYEEAEVPVYDKPVAEDSTVPVAALHYTYDAAANVGNFVMMADVPEDCEYEEIGIAFYYKKTDVFNPTAFRLTLNNKMVTSRFTELNEEGAYVVNFKKMKDDTAYAARGYISYYDSEGALKIAYTDQINILNFEQA